jgi:hypothetical protein
LPICFCLLLTEVSAIGRSNTGLGTCAEGIHKRRKGARRVPVSNGDVQHRRRGAGWHCEPETSIFEGSAQSKEPENDEDDHDEPDDVDDLVHWFLS